MKAKPGNKYWLLLIGLSVSAGALYLALQGIQWADLAATMVTADRTSLVFCIGMIGFGIILRGWRWSLIAHQEGISTLKYSRAVNLGLLGNQLLPGRVGELVRIFALMRLLPAGMSVALGSAVLDRAVDVLVLLLVAGGLTLGLTRTIVPQQGLTALMLMLGAIIFGFMVLHSKGFARWLAAWSERWLHRWSLRPETFLPTFNAMSRRFLQPAPALQLMIAAVAVLIADYLSVLAALNSVGLDLSSEAPLFLWVSLAASSALPSAPGYVGVYQLAAVWSLSGYNVPPYQAIAVAFVLQIVALLVSIVGAVSDLLEKKRVTRRQGLRPVDRTTTK